MSLSKKNVNYFDLNNRDRNFIFLEIFFIFEKIYADYLMGHSMIDFGDMIVKSREIVKELCVGKKYDYILIDEFQDISKARALLIKELIL